MRNAFVNGNTDFCSYMSYRMGTPVGETVLVGFDGTRQLSDTVDMCAWVVTGGDYFSSYEKNKVKVPIFDEYKIDNGADEEDCLLKDYASGSLFNLSNAALSNNCRLGARAFYGESYWAWEKDESATFYEGEYSELKKFNSVKSGTDHIAYTTLHVFRDYGVFTVRDLVQTEEDLPPIRTGSTLSAGSWVIIAIVSAGAVGAVAILVYKKVKKRPAAKTAEE